jgi:hypothetical protein
MSGTCTSGSLCPPKTAQILTWKVVQLVGAGQLDLAQWMIDDGLEQVRFGHQLHKTIWSADAQGV